MQNENIIYVRRYIWQKDVEGNTESFIRILSGSLLEHANFRESLLADEEIICASSVYLSEYNVNALEQHDIIKMKNKEENKNETL